MDFSLSDEQLQLRDAVRRFCDREYPVETRGTPADRQDAARRWALMAEMGLLGLPFDPDHGGSGLSAVELMIVAQEFGRCLAPEPYLSTVVLAGGVLAAAGSAEQASDLLPDVIGGTRQLALALSEPQARYDLADIVTRASPAQDAYVLNGRKTLVLNGDTADVLLVAARTAGAALDTQGITLFLVDPKTPGVRIQGYPTLDGRRAASIEFKDVRIDANRVLGPAGGAFALIDSAVDRAIAVLCAEATGALDALIALTVDFVKVRKQFGVPLGKFQVLQHRLVDMTIGLEGAKSMASVAAMAIDSAEPAQRRRLISAAKVQIGNVGRFVSEWSIQMHGAMGMTEEYQAGHYVKRLMVIDQLFGNAQHHLRLFAEQPAS